MSIGQWATSVGSNVGDSTVAGGLLSQRLFWRGRYCLYRNCNVLLSMGYENNLTSFLAEWYRKLLSIHIEFGSETYFHCKVISGLILLIVWGDSTTKEIKQGNTPCNRYWGIKCWLRHV